MVIRLIICLVIGYLLGSLSGSIITSKVFFKSDVRQHGSGNAGMTNSLRVYGVGAAVSTTLVDALKSVAAMLIACYIGGTNAMIAAGAGVMLGHAYPLYFGFRGGKCVICIAVVGSFISWQTVLIAVAMFAVIVLLTGIVSASSCGAMLTAMLAAVLLDVEPGRLVFIIAACSFVIFLHRSNIKRILNGTEKKIKPKGGAAK
ncbi:MAG: glycerol-3-phosphate 1-O-acyltransferase PlsY [Clostridia bacterium]|nr:glycerol-3-phosphate 1-O-acyltransferase PlsY [Clostridia bacterium]